MIEVLKKEIFYAVKPMLDGIDDSMLYSFFEGKAGIGWTDNCDNPTCVLIKCEDFYFLGGDCCSPDAVELIGIISQQTGYITIIPSDMAWWDIINTSCEKYNIGEPKKVLRFATTSPSAFDIQNLESITARIDTMPEFTLELINEDNYNACRNEGWSYSLVGNFEDYKEFNDNAFGFVVKKGDTIVSGISAYGYYSGGYEIEIDTRPEFRRMGLARIIGAKYVLECCKRGKRPHWDAANKTSLNIALNLGFINMGEYPCIEVVRNK